MLCRTKGQPENCLPEDFPSLYCADVCCVTVRGQVRRTPGDYLIMEPDHVRNVQRIS